MVSHLALVTEAVVSADGGDGGERVVVNVILEVARNEPTGRT
jgi:hypothetical protein